MLSYLDDVDIAVFETSLSLLLAMAWPACRSGPGEDTFEQKQPRKREETFRRWVESSE